MDAELTPAQRLADPPGQPSAAPAAAGGGEMRPATVLFLLTRVDCIDGVAAYLESLVTGLHARGDRAVIVSGEVTTTGGSLARQQAIAAAAGDWIVLEGLGGARPRLRDVARVLAVLRAHDIDVISPQGFSALPFAALLGRLSGRPVVAGFHLLPSWHAAERFAASRPPALRQRLAYRLVNALFRADHYIAISEEASLFFQDLCGIPERRVSKILHGIDIGFFRPPTEAERRAARARFGLDAAVFVAVLPGRLNHSKGHALAAAAIRRLRARRPGLRIACLFAGDGGDRAAIEAEVLCSRADAEVFRFLGFVDRSTMRDAFWAADIMLLPSRGEGFALVVPEAMCCGAIVIRTPSGGWQDQIIEGRTGYLAPFDDPEALARTIERVLDFEDRGAMRAEAMAFAAARFSRCRMLDATSALFRGTAARRRTGQAAADPASPRRGWSVRPAQPGPPRRHPPD